jgi:hypothetical protein
MIDDLDEALRKLLIRELPISSNEIDVSFDQPKREWSARLSRPTINLYLHDIRENTRLRRERSPYELERRTDTVVQRARPYRVDLHYLVTAWATAPEDEHRMLARTLLALLRFQALPSDLLTDGLQDQPSDVPLRVAQSDTLDKPSELWSVLDNQQRPGITFAVTLAFNPYAPVERPLTRTAEFKFGQDDGGEQNHGSFSIRGLVRSRRPLENLRVLLVEGGREATLMPNGEFGIRNIQPGGYTLQVTADNHPTSQHKITVPAQSYDVEL